MKIKRAEVVRTARAIIEGGMGIIEGSRRLCSLMYEVSDHEFDADFMLFVAIADETDHLPVDTVRGLWSLEALQRKDREIKEAEDFYRSRIVEPCQKLVARFE